MTPLFSFSRSVSRRKRTSRPGFTLTELLMAVGILGIVAMFAIPKVMESSQSGRSLAVYREFITSLSQTYEEYCNHHKPTADTTMDDILKYMNTLGPDTTSVIDNRAGADVQPQYKTLSCNGSTTFNGVPGKCVKLYNGGVLFYWVDNKFGGTKPKNMVFVVLDPDGKAKDAARANGRSKGVQIHLYHNGQVTSQRNARTDTDGFWGGQYIHQYNGPVWTPRPEWDPLWLKY